MNRPGPVNSGAQPARLILVRHGETDANVHHRLQGHMDGRLTGVGVTQARRLAEYLSNVQIDHIYSSDLSRAATTAAQIATHHPQLAVITTPLIREWNVGTLDGEPAATLQRAAAAAGQTVATFRPPEGETLAEVRQRAAGFLADITLRHGGESLLICAHGDFLRMLLGIIRGQSIDRALQQPFANASYTILEAAAGGGWKITSLNAVPAAEQDS